MIKEICHRKFKEDPDYFSLHWAVTNNCDYKCDYCGVYKKEKIYNFENILKFINTMGENKNVDTVLFGGEPLIHPNILQIVGELETDIRICTNLSRNLRFFRELIGINRNLTIVSSLHYAREDITDFYNKVKYLLEYTKFVKVKVMWDSRYKEDCKKAYQVLKPLEISGNCKIYFDMVYHEICQFLDEDIEFFESIQNDDRFYVRTDEGEEYTSYNEIRRMFNGFPNFYKWKCYCGRKGLFIDSDGTVYLCQTKRNKGKQLFNINQYMDVFKTTIKYNLNPIICDEDDFCHDVVIPRRISRAWTEYD